jgi:hypothetical protein
MHKNSENEHSSMSMTEASLNQTLFYAISHLRGKNQAYSTCWQVRYNRYIRMCVLISRDTSI